MLKPASPLLSPFSQFDLSSRQSVIAAVSGGSDSTALLLLLHDHLVGLRGNAPQLVAVTVDHALRASSADEAAAVARLCAGSGIEHRIMRWSEPKPSSGIPAAAREARYRLLAQAAAEAGADIVFTGHTADDQAETVFMRKERGDGMGLAGMAPGTLYDGAVWLLRPLLGERRQDLKDYLVGRGAPWSEDATNADIRFERPRARARLAPDDRPAEQGGEAASLLALARREAGRRTDVAGRAAGLLSALARRAAPGLLHLDPSFAGHHDREAALRALSVLLATVGGSGFPPPAERVEELLARLADPPFRGTLSRTLVAARGDGVWLARETRGLPEARPAEDGAVWDGRFRLRMGKDGGTLLIAARRSVGSEPAAALDRRLPPSLLRAALASQPILLSAATGEVPDEPPRGVSLVPVAAPYGRFLPSFDIELARVLGRLIGAPPVPQPPFQEHIESKA